MGTSAAAGCLIDMARCASLFALALIALASSEAAADDLSATRSQQLREVSHAVDLRIDDGLATYTVRRTFANTGIRADEAHLGIDLPTGAAVTGVRIRARDRWYSAELLEAQEAAEKYHELTSLGAWRPMDPALMQWVWADRMHLQVFPVLPGAASTVEYTLTAPLHYREGRYVVSYPRFDPDHEGNALAAPVVRIHPGHGDATTTILIDGQPTAPDTPVVLGAPRAEPWIGDGAPTGDYGYAWSELTIKQAGTARSAKVTVDINHTYRGDLKIELVAPSGARTPVAELDGGENDVRQTFDITLAEESSIRGQWHLVVADRAGLDVGTIDAWSLALATSASSDARKYRQVAATDVPVFIPDAKDGGGGSNLAVFEIEPPPIREVDVHLGRVPVADGINFVRLAVEAAPELSQLPRGASVVFILDASRSADPVPVQLEAAKAYMSHLPDAKAEVVLFRRDGTRVAGSFLPGPKLWTAIDAAKERGELEQGNGSALERGLQVAATALRGRSGPKRIVLLTDALLRTRFANADAMLALRTAPRGTVTHLVIPNARATETRLRRDDAHPLASIPAATGGVLYGLECEDCSSQKDLRPALLGLVRPVGIDSFALATAGLEDAPPTPDVLKEGAAYGFMINNATAPQQIVLTGKIWGRSFRRVVRASRRFSDATAAFVFSEDEHQDLTPEQMMKVAMRGRAVSPVTSYLAVEPGVRPSTIGLTRTEIGSAFGSGGLGLVGRGAGGGGRTQQKAWTIPELMTAGIAACVASHHPAPGWSAPIEVETTYREVVDVISSGPSDAFTTCLVEAAWAVDLTWNFSHRRMSYSLRLSEA